MPSNEAARTPLPELLTTDEVATLSRRSPRTIRNRVGLGLEPKPVRRGGRLLFERDAVLAWLYGRAQGAK